jgi:hypothetical protein
MWYAFETALGSDGTAALVTTLVRETYDAD